MSSSFDTDDIRELWGSSTLFYKSVLRFTTFENVDSSVAYEHSRYTVPHCIIRPLLTQLNALLGTRGTSVITPAMVDEVAREYDAPIPPRKCETLTEEISSAFKVTLTEDAAKVVDWILRSWLASVFETIAKIAVNDPTRRQTVKDAVNQHLPQEYVEYVQKYNPRYTKKDGYLRVLFEHGLQYAPQGVSTAFSTEDHSSPRVRGVLKMLGNELLPMQPTDIDVNNVGKTIFTCTLLSNLIQSLGILVPTLSIRTLASDEASRTLCVNPNDKEDRKLYTLADPEETFGAPNWFYSADQQKTRIVKIRTWYQELRESQQKMINAQGESDSSNEPPSKRARCAQLPPAAIPPLGSKSYLFLDAEGFNILVAHLGTHLRYGGLPFEDAAYTRFQEVCERRSRMILYKADQIMRQIHIQDWSKVVLTTNIMKMAFNEMRW